MGDRKGYTPQWAHHLNLAFCSCKFCEYLVFFLTKYFFIRQVFFTKSATFFLDIENLLSRRFIKRKHNFFFVSVAPRCMIGSGMAY